MGATATANAGPQAYNFKNGAAPMKGGVAHKKNAMSLLDYQQLNNSFLDQNLSSIMGPAPK